MDERTRIDQHARGFFEGLWQHGDHWERESSAFEQTKYVRTLALLAVTWVRTSCIQWRKESRSA
jgi:hypothetical protein